MKTTKSDESKHRQPTLWGYLQKDTAEQESYAEACVSPRMAETDTINISKQEPGLVEEILSAENMYSMPTSRLKGTRERAVLTG